MKHLYYNICSVLIMAMIFGSCSDIYDNIKDFSPKETVYPAKFDTLGWKLGYERVVFYLNKGGLVSSDQMKLGKAKKTIIEYDGKRIVVDSLCSFVNISGLTEQKLYHFKIYTEDQYGNKSIPQEAQLTPFTKTDLDVLSLVPPNVIESTSAAVVEWGMPIESDLYQFFSYTGEYTDKDGQVHSFNGGNLPSFIVENVLLDVEIPIKITAKILPYTGGVPLLDTIPAWETYYDLRISEAAKPAIFLKTPEAASVINIHSSQFPIEFSWTTIPEVSSYVLKISKVRDFPAESTKVIDLGDVSSYSMTKDEAESQVFTDFEPLSTTTAYYWQIEPKEQALSVRLQSRTVNYKYVEGELVQENIDTHDPRSRYTGDNLFANEPGVYYNADCAVVWQNNTVEVSFYGRYIAWYGLRNNDLGHGQVYIDGVLDSDINCWANYRRVEKLYEKFWPSDGNHTIKVVASPGTIVHDYFTRVYEKK